MIDFTSDLVILLFIVRWVSCDLSFVFVDDVLISYGFAFVCEVGTFDV